MSEFNEFKLSYTANQINERLGRINILAEKNELPTKTSDLINDSNFVTKDALDQKAERALYINLTYDEENDMYIPDKTRDEIEIAYQNERLIYVRCENLTLPLIGRNVIYDDYGEVDDIGYSFSAFIADVTVICVLFYSSEIGVGTFIEVPLTVNGIAPDEMGNI